MCDSKLSLTYNSPNKTQQITKDAPCFTKPEPPPTMMPTFPTQQGEGSGNTATPAMSSDPPPGLVTTSPSLVDSGSSFSLTPDPSGLGSESSLPWPTSHPQYLTTINYQDMFTETEGVLIWGGSDRFYHHQSCHYILHHSFHQVLDSWLHGGLLQGQVDNF